MTASRGSPTEVFMEENSPLLTDDVTGKQAVTRWRCIEKSNVDGLLRNSGVKPYVRPNPFLHKAIPPERMPYKCRLCDYCTALHREFVRHMAKHTGVNPYACKVCEYATDNQGNLTKHMAMVHKRKKPQDYSTARKGKLDTRVVKRACENSFMCGVCGYRAAERCQLAGHMKTHILPREKPYKCDQCNYCTDRKSSFDMHKAKHTGKKKHMCWECGFRTVYRSNLLSHMNVHTGGKPLKCNQCDYCTARKGDLNKHMLKHMGEKPYSCEECGFRTVYRSNLSKHMKTHRGEKTYKCDQCDYCTARKEHLDTHMAKHTSEKPYMCGECGFRTDYRSSLSAHMKRHLLEKPYKCE
ncbi:zinc finger protein 665-like [Branchiostoma lanceolatum]|uniref:zinc finger protein 665-like n=1 Tax=Branchiostoma lanceolatum TaxID=7740 RepID=UPI003452167F